LIRNSIKGAILQTEKHIRHKCGVLPPLVFSTLREVPVAPTPLADVPAIMDYLVVGGDDVRAKGLLSYTLGREPYMVSRNTLAGGPYLF